MSGDFLRGVIVGLEICKIIVIAICVIHYLRNKRCKDDD